MRKYWRQRVRVIYDTRTGTFTIILNEVPIAESDEEDPGVILDYDAAGNVVALKVLDGSRRVVQPTQLIYELAGYAA